MSFRKRNVGVPSGREPTPPRLNDELPGDSSPKRATVHTLVHGVRPSPLDGRPTTSTGTRSLDSLLAGHAGLVLGNSILIEESGTTDYAGTLLRYFAAEGIIQGQRVLVVGMGEAWGRELPGAVGVADANEEKQKGSSQGSLAMKIAWRYEKLGNSREASPRGGSTPFVTRLLYHIKSTQLAINSILTLLVTALPDRGPAQDTSVKGDTTVEQGFCHVFDLTKRLIIPSPDAINYVPVKATSATTSPFISIIEALENQLSSSSQTSVHRVIIPSLLSPAFYPPHSSMPQHILQFLHMLRSVLRKYPTQIVAMISLPLTLHPRETGLTRWMELLSDGVLELIPFPHTADDGPSASASSVSAAQEEKPQGMAKIHRLPIFHERGGGTVGGAGVGDDLAFIVTKKRFMIKPFSLPPMEGDTEAQRGENGGQPTKVNIDF